MNILVLNCGSSSLKYQLIDMDNSEAVLAKGLCERIGIEGSLLKHSRPDHENFVLDKPMKDHTDAVQLVIDALLDENHGVIRSINEVNAIGHRVVHGGDYFSDSVLITDDVKKAIEACCELAPLHNPPNLVGIRACEQLMPKVPQVAVFDTAFHQTMPEKAYLYALPYELYEESKIRRYGFHGTSHKYVSRKAAQLLGKPVESLKIITCHLGNGASVCAVDSGKSVGTSMGFTPLEGLTMGTRCGDIDPAIIMFLMQNKGLSIEETDNLLNKKSGVLGISGVSSDFRDLETAANNGHKRAQIALDQFYYSVAKYVGSYAAAMNGVDAIVFTAGLGENNGEAREIICGYLEFLGLHVDKEKNTTRGQDIDISDSSSKIRALVIPTNEELMIARDTMTCIKP